MNETKCVTVIPPCWLRGHKWYNAYGWQRNGQPVEDWKALIQTWEDDVPYQDGEPKKSKYANVKIN